MPGGEVTLIVCGAPLAARTGDVVQALMVDGWSVSVVGTAASAGWMDTDAVAAVVGEPVRFGFRQPGQAKRGGAGGAVVVCPATFNTLNRAAMGVSDSYALGVLCGAMGAGVPLVVVPMVNHKLWGHPAWSGTLEVFGQVGAVLVDVHTGAVGACAVRSGTGDGVVERFDPRWLPARLRAAQDSAGR